jgi:hypothetical protein
VSEVAGLETALDFGFIPPYHNDGINDGTDVGKDGFLSRNYGSQNRRQSRKYRFHNGRQPKGDHSRNEDMTK